MWVCVCRKETYPAETGHGQGHTRLKLVWVFLAEAGDEGDGCSDHALETDRQGYVYKEQMFFSWSSALLIPHRSDTGSRDKTNCFTIINVGYTNKQTN